MGDKEENLFFQKLLSEANTMEAMVDNDSESLNELVLQHMARLQIKRDTIVEVHFAVVWKLFVMLHT